MEPAAALTLPPADMVSMPPLPAPDGGVLVIWETPALPAVVARDPAESEPAIPNVGVVVVLGLSLLGCGVLPLQAAKAMTRIDVGNSVRMLHHSALLRQTMGSF